MLKILEWQLDRMADAFYDGTTRQLVEILRDAFPEETAFYDDEALTKLVLRGRRSAEGYGMARGVDIERYLYLMIVLGDDFDVEVAWARETFTREDYSGQVRMDVAWAIFEGRDDAQPGVPFMP